MDSKERLTALMEHLNLNANKLAKAIGLPRAQNLYDVLDGTVNISGKLAAKITAVYPDINTSWLISGEGDMLLKSSKGKPPETYGELLDLYRRSNKNLEKYAAMLEGRLEELEKKLEKKG